MPRAKHSNGKIKPTSANVAMADRQRRAMDLKLAGATFEQIAQQIGYADASGAYRAVQRGLTETQRPAADELRETFSRRLDRLLLAVWPQAVHGDLKAVECARRLVDQQAKLHGANLPVKSEVDVTVTERSAADAALDELVAELERRARTEESSAQTPSK
jgi:hypothetical protein